ncbi:hypothetical protein [Niveibacterium sp. SC-1]|uniref:hypothetical protein n=1 Tax=Niveibacterium sp. SC-1 TaxID=3135646 RepID=UPI00312023BA
MTPQNKTARTGYPASRKQVSSTHHNPAIDVLLSRLDGVKRTGPDRWLARCPAHDDGHASLSVRELDDGRILLHDFAGCSADEVVGAIGLALADLMPPRPLAVDRMPGERRPFPALDVLRALSFECQVVLMVAADVSEGRPLAARDRDRLGAAIGRIQSGLALAEDAR